MYDDSSQWEYNWRIYIRKTLGQHRKSSTVGEEEDGVFHFLARLVFKLQPVYGRATTVKTEAKTSDSLLTFLISHHKCGQPWKNQEQVAQGVF